MISESESTNPVDEFVVEVRHLKFTQTAHCFLDVARR